jgi:hypothetical protein
MGGKSKCANRLFETKLIKEEQLLEAIIVFVIEFPGFHLTLITNENIEN